MSDEVPEGVDPTSPVSESQAADIRAITSRISKVTQARALADVGKYDKALELLRRVRDAYDEQRQREQVDWLIADVQRRQRGG